MDEIKIIDFDDDGMNVPTYEGLDYGDATAKQPIIPENPESPVGTTMDFTDLLKSIFGFTGQDGDQASIDMSEMLNQYLSFIRENTDYNNAWSAEQAQKQMDFQTASQKIAQQFNSKEAAKNRKWQEYMSNTAHQREIADLKKAGLNPVLSAMGGNGAAVTSGATAAGSSPTSGAKGDADQSANSAITSMLGSMVSTMSHLAEAAMSAQTQLSVADKYTQMEQMIEHMKEIYAEHEHLNYPDNMWETIGTLFHTFFGDNDDNQGKPLEYVKGKLWELRNKDKKKDYNQRQVDKGRKRKSVFDEVYLDDSYFSYDDPFWTKVIKSFGQQ